jgi:addiction module RelE/StbE family toxin
MRVVIKENAYRDLASIFSYIAKNNQTAGRAVVAWIVGAIEQLEFFPRMGRSQSVPGTRERVVPRLPYIIVYQIDEDREELAVIAVFHAAQNR